MKKIPDPSYCWSKMHTHFLMMTNWFCPNQKIKPILFLSLYMYVCLYIICMFSLLSVRQSLSLSVLVYLSFFVCLLFAVCLTVFVFVQVIVFLKVFLCLFVTLCLFVNICLSVSLCVFFSLAKLKQIKNRLNIIEVKTSRLLLYCIVLYCHTFQSEDVSIRNYMIFSFRLQFWLE